MRKERGKGKESRKKGKERKEKKRKEVNNRQVFQLFFIFVQPGLGLAYWRSNWLHGVMVNIRGFDSRAPSSILGAASFFIFYFSALL